MLEVQYEELVADLEHQARRIVTHCGLEWDDACLTFYETERHQFGVDAPTDIGRKLEPLTGCRWREDNRFHSHDILYPNYRYKRYIA
jgi:hypothetical protein